MAPIQNPTVVEMVDLINKTLSSPRPTERRLLALWIYLPVIVNTPGGLFHMRSSLEASRIECQLATGRNEAGIVVDSALSGSWLGTVGYLALLDQIGTSVQHRHPPRFESGSSGFEQALAHFTSVSDDDSICLYALRNSLAHHFSLVNIPPPRTGVARAKKLTRLFTLTRGAGVLLQRPRKPWNPKRPNRGEPTVVDVELLGDLVEDAVRQMYQVYLAGDLQIRTGGKSLVVWSRGRFFSHAG